MYSQWAVDVSKAYWLSRFFKVGMPRGLIMCLCFCNIPQQGVAVFAEQ
jgi:hypothetical protein